MAIGTRIIIVCAFSFIVGCGKFDPAKKLYNLRLEEISQLNSGKGQVFQGSPVTAAQSTVGYSDSEIIANKNKNFDPYFTEVTISQTQNGYLENGDVQIFPDYEGDLKRARPGLFGHWLFSTGSDTHDFVGQLMAFYWLNKQAEVVTAAAPGGWFVENKNVAVYSKCLEMQNAFWEGESRLMCIGYVNHQHLSYDASIFLHEMGHGNLDFATSNPQGGPTIYIDSYQSCILEDGGGNNLVDAQTGKLATFKCCASTSGCMSAINEGQADYHAFTVLNRGTLGEFLVNNLSGLEHRNADEHITVANPLDLTEMYNGDPLVTDTAPSYVSSVNKVAFNRQFGPEVHNLGAVWAAVWWNLRQSSNLGQANTDKLFFSHLHLMDNQDTFRTALDAVLYALTQLYANAEAGYATQAEAQAAWDKVVATFLAHGIVKTVAAPARP